MHPIAALMLSEALEEERRRVLRHPRPWMNVERHDRSQSGQGAFRLPRIFRLADSKA